MHFLCQEPVSISEVKNCIKEMKFDELREMMISPLSFGTAGNNMLFCTYNSPVMIGWIKTPEILKVSLADCCLLLWGCGLE